MTLLSPSSQAAVRDWRNDAEEIHIIEESLDEEQEEEEFERQRPSCSCMNYFGYFTRRKCLSTGTCSVTCNSSCRDKADRGRRLCTSTYLPPGLSVPKTSHWQKVGKQTMTTFRKFNLEEKNSDKCPQNNQDYRLLNLHSLTADLLLPRPTIFFT